MPRRKAATPPETFDEPWKQIVTALFRPFLDFFAPQTAAQIDWSREPQFLDKELRRIAKGFGRSRRATADFLVKVWRLDGEEEWLIIHIELQAQRDERFAERMFLYNVRAYDLYRRPVVSLAVLADADASWRPDRFGYGDGESRTSLRYPVVKLLDYRDRQAELEASANPFGLAVLAHLKTQETRGDAESRLAWKVRLARLLFDRRWSRKEIEELFQFLDWIMALPEPLEDRFEVTYEQLEREETMAETMAPLLLRAKARGIQQGLRSALVRQLTAKFGEMPDRVVAQIEGITDTAELYRLTDLILTAQTLKEMGLSQD